MSKRTLKTIDLNLDEPGKDLSRLFASSLSDPLFAQQAEMLPIERLLDNPYQPRRQMREDTLNDLAQVIAGQGFQGVLAARSHPERRGFYQLAAGHRRREAARRAGLITLPVVVRDLADEEMVTIAITENIQRDDLTPLEEGRIYLLMNTEMGYKLEQIAREVGKTLGYIYNRVRVAKAPPDVQALVEEKPDSLRAVANLIKVKSEQGRAGIIKQLLAGTLTTDDLPLYIQRLNLENAEPDLDPIEVIPEPQDQPTSLLDVERPKEPELAPDTEQDIVLVNGAAMAVERSVPRQPPPTPGQAGWSKSSISAAELEQISLVRARRSKLSRALGTLQAFDDLLTGETSLSNEEKLDLATLALLADRLCARFGISKDG